MEAKIERAEMGHDPEGARTRYYGQGLKQSVHVHADEERETKGFQEATASFIYVRREVQRERGRYNVYF
jgi:hypothetical protein